VNICTRAWPCKSNDV